ncbi:MAG: hypothetical protein QW620_06005 [Thermoplasmata archaeon]
MQQKNIGEIEEEAKKRYFHVGLSYALYYIILGSLLFSPYIKILEEINGPIISILFFVCPWGILLIFTIHMLKPLARYLPRLWAKEHYIITHFTLPFLFLPVGWGLLFAVLFFWWWLYDIKGPYPPVSQYLICLVFSLLYCYAVFKEHYNFYLKRLGVKHPGISVSEV